MCFELDSRPPIPPIAGAAVDGRRIELTSADGTAFAAFAADPVAANGAGMLILPDVRGLHPYYEELALRCAEAGVAALAIDYFGRTAGTDPRPADFEHMAHVRQTTFANLVADAAAGATELRRREQVRALFSVGFCYGGRLSFLAATRPELALAGAIGFYGWPGSGEFHAGMPSPTDVAGSMKCPLLALFGAADQGIPADAVEKFRVALEAAGVEHEVISYPGAPHGFFDKKAAEFADASADSWRRVMDFVGGLTPPVG
jgi:carboxymethylenebutenolidase